REHAKSCPGMELLLTFVSVLSSTCKIASKMPERQVVDTFEDVRQLWDNDFREALGMTIEKFPSFNTCWDNLIVISLLQGGFEDSIMLFQIGITTQTIG